MLHQIAWLHLFCQCTCHTLTWFATQNIVMYCGYERAECVTASALLLGDVWCPFNMAVCAVSNGDSPSLFASPVGCAYRDAGQTWHPFPRHWMRVLCDQTYSYRSVPCVAKSGIKICLTVGLQVCLYWCALRCIRHCPRSLVYTAWSLQKEEDTWPWGHSVGAPVCVRLFSNESDGGLR